MRFAVWLVPILVLTPFVACAAAEHTKDSLDKVKQGLKDQKAVLVDVRETREWDNGHLEDAVLVPLSELDRGKDTEEYAQELTKKLPKDCVIYCHCAKGKRALLAGDTLKELGYDVRPLKQGYADLLKAGFPKAKKQE